MSDCKPVFWLYRLCRIGQGWLLLAALCWPLAGQAGSVNLGPHSDYRAGLGFVHYGYTADAMLSAGMNAVLVQSDGKMFNKYSQLDCLYKDISPHAVDGKPGGMYCVMAVLPAPQLHRLLLPENPADEHGEVGDVLQYMIEVGGEGLYGGQEPLEVLIEEPPKVHFGTLPPVCTRNQGTIICQVSQRMRSADGMFRLRLPLQIEQPPPGGYAFNVYIPAWLLVDNCREGNCRPDDRHPLTPPLTKLHIAEPYPIDQWLVCGLLLGMAVLLGGWMICRRHDLRRLCRAGAALVLRRLNT